MKVYLAEMDWSIFINCEDVIEVWSRFIKMMKGLVVKFVPKKMRKTVKKPMWWNKHIQNLGRKKTRSWDRYKLDKTEGNYILRRLLRRPRFCSASGLFVECRIPNCKAVIRNLIFRFMTRLDLSKNSIIFTILGSDIRWTSRIRRHWVKS